MRWLPVGEDDDEDERDLGVAEHGELGRLPEQAVTALAQGRRSCSRTVSAQPVPPHGASSFIRASLASSSIQRWRKSNRSEGERGKWRGAVRGGSEGEGRAALKRKAKAVAGVRLRG